MALLDPKFLAVKQGLISSLDRLRTAVDPLSAAAKDGLLEDPGRGLADCAELLDGEAAKLRSNRFRIGIFGLIKAGKSTLINALAEEYITEVDSLPATTAALHLVKRPGKPVVKFLPGSGKPEREITREEAVRILDEKANPNNVEQVDWIDYPVDLKYLEDDVVLVDTPGLGYILKTVSERAGRELHESVHTVVLVVRVFGGQLWQREIREFLAEAVQRCPRVFVVVNCDEKKPDEWGEEPFKRIRDRFANELRDAGRILRAALEDGTITVHFTSALLAASALLRLRGNAAGTDPAALNSELELSRFLDFRKSLSEFAAGDKRLWDDLRFRARALAERIGASREAVRSQVMVHLKSALDRSREDEKRLSQQISQLDAGIREVKDSVALEAEDLIGELIEKAQVKADEFLEEQVHPAVERWLGTSDTPAQLEVELGRLLDAWRPQLQSFMDKRLAAFTKRVALKIRSELFHRLNTAVDIKTEVALDFRDVARMPQYDFSADLERGLGKALTYVLAAVNAFVFGHLCGGEGTAFISPDVAGSLAGGAVGFVGTVVLGKALIRGALASAFRAFLRNRSIPAMVKGFFHEAAIRKLGDTKTELRKLMRDGFQKKRDDIVAKIGGDIGKALDEQHRALAQLWGKQRDDLVKKTAQLTALGGKVEEFVKSADDAVKAAREAGL